MGGKIMSYLKVSDVGVQVGVLLNDLFLDLLLEFPALCLELGRGEVAARLM